MEELTAAGDLGNGAAVEGLVAAWRYTAEIISDPELHAPATREYDDDLDYGPVPPPEVP
jgi:hypothetical protein